MDQRQLYGYAVRVEWHACAHGHVAWYGGRERGYWIVSVHAPKGNVLFMTMCDSEKDAWFLGEGAARHHRENEVGPSMFGHERTAMDCLIRATWERQQAAALRDEYPPLAEAHDWTADAYERLAETWGR